MASLHSFISLLDPPLSTKPANTTTTAFSGLVDKSGYKIDRQTQEKITDGGRDAYEKYSGYVDLSHLSYICRCSRFDEALN